MKLLSKLILTFVVLAFLPLLLMAGILFGVHRSQLMEAGRERVRQAAAGKSAQVGLLLQRTVEQVEQLARSRPLIERVAGSDQAAGERLEALLERDRAWINADEAARAALAEPLLNNETAAQLRRFQQSAPTRYAEIMLTDAAGALVAATNVTTDYYQADEAWWQRAYDEGAGATYVGPIAYDKSAEVFSLDVVTAVRDEAGRALGVLKVSHEVDALFQAVRALEIGAGGQGHLVDSQGRTVFKAADAPGLMDLNAEAMRAIRSAPDGVFVGQVTTGNEQPQVVGFAVVRQSGRPAHVEGWPWFVVVTQPAADVYAPSRRVLGWSALVLALPMAGLLLLAVYWKRNLVEPIWALHWAAQQVAAGRLDVRVQVGQGDELEQVGHQFNRMAAALQRHEQDQRREIRRHTDETRQSDMQRQRVRDAFSAQMQSIAEGMRDRIDALGDRISSAGEEQASREAITSACAEISAYVEDLRDLCTVEAGRMRLEPERLNLGECLRSALRVLEPIRKRYEADVRIPPEADETRVVADGPKVKQVLYALLSNAIKYGGQGTTVTVSVGRSEDATVIGVRDQGPGIQPEAAETVFDPPLTYTPLPWSPEDRIGLNLPIARQFVELHGGEVWVESGSDGGSAFFFTLADRDLPRSKGS